MSNGNIGSNQAPLRDIKLQIGTTLSLTFQGHQGQIRHGRWTPDICFPINV